MAACDPRAVVYLSLCGPGGGMTSASYEQTRTPSPWRRLWAGLALSLASSWMRLGFPQPPHQSLSQPPAIYRSTHLP